MSKPINMYTKMIAKKLNCNIDYAILIQMANEVHDFHYDKWTMEDAINSFDDEIPQDLKMLLDKNEVLLLTSPSQTTWLLGYKKISLS